MYFRKGFKNKCLHGHLQDLRGRGLPRVELKAKVAGVYGVDLEETEVAIKRLVSVLCLNEYFRYSYGKDLLEARAGELAALRSDQTRYEKWKAGSKKIPFKHLVAAIDFVSTNLR